MASRTELKATFSGGNRISESDFALLIDSLAHLSDDKANGDIVGQSDLTSIQTTMSQLQALAQSAKDTADSVGTNHPSYDEMRTEDQVIKSEAIASVKTDTDALKAVNDAQQIQIANLQTTLNTTTTDLTQDINSLLANQVSVGSKADLTYVDSLKASTDSDIAGRAPLVHEHPEYATKVSIANANYITLADIPQFASPVHGHDVSEIVGLNDLFTTPAQVDQKIADASNTIDQIEQLKDLFYEKDETDQKFHVARWRTDQISLFNPSVEAVAQPFVDQAKVEIMAEVEEVRTSLFADKTSILSDLAQTRAEIEVSIGNTNSTVETNRHNAEQGRIALQGNIDQVAINATASIASSQSHVLSELASVRAEVLAETATNASAITQAGTDANTYTDTKISDLLNGAGAAFDTLKELQDHIETNESDAATELTNQVGLLQAQITANDADLSGVIVSLGNRKTEIDLLEARATSLEAKDTTIETDLASAVSAHNTLQASHDALLVAHNNLVNRVTTLENTAYAEAGYTFP